MCGDPTLNIHHGFPLVLLLCYMNVIGNCIWSLTLVTEQISIHLSQASLADSRFPHERHDCLVGWYKNGCFDSIVIEHLAEFEFSGIGVED